jgi:hypothetical protein
LICSLLLGVAVLQVMGGLPVAVVVGSGTLPISMLLQEQPL